MVRDRWRTVRVAGTAAALAAVLALCGCASPSSSPVQGLSTHRGAAVPQSSATSSDEHPTAYWLAGRRRAAITTYGSSGCPKVPVTVEVTNATRVVLRLRDYGSRFCTADLVATTSELVLPEAVSRTATVRVVLRAKGFGDTALALRVSPTVPAGARR